MYPETPVDANSPRLAGRWWPFGGVFSTEIQGSSWGGEVGFCRAENGRIGCHSRQTFCRFRGAFLRSIATAETSGTKQGYRKKRTKRRRRMTQRCARRLAPLRSRDTSVSSQSDASAATAFLQASCSSTGRKLPCRQGHFRYTKPDVRMSRMGRGIASANRGLFREGSLR